MSAKNLDKHNRFRSITVGFRVSPEEHEHINVAVALSGLSKQEYCYRRCLGRDIVVQGNPKVYKALKDQLALVLEELKRIEAGQGISDELLENINQLGIGPQGFGGKTTALCVNIEQYPAHIASLPVAVNINCHVTRHMKEVI